MPWYYAGPEAKPVGPVSLDELHACRVTGIISPETYVIEHTGQPGEVRVWKRFREIFPPSPNLPPLPPAPATALPLPPPQAAVPAHPLFPSAASTPRLHPVFPSQARPDPYYAARKTNPWCSWGFGLGLASLPLLLLCGLGIFTAIASLGISLVGLLQVQRNREQTGTGLAAAGLLLSGLTLLIALIILAVAVPAAIKHHQLTVTEQTSNDSE